MEKTCPDCLRALELSLAHWYSRDGGRYWSTYCRQCTGARSVKARSLRYQKDASFRAWDKERVSRRLRENKAAVNAYVNLRYHTKAKRVPKWANLQAIAAIYLHAQDVTRKTGILHHVDHIIPLHGKKVSGLHVEANLRVIPATDNIRKGNRYQPEEQ